MVKVQVSYGAEWRSKWQAVDWAIARSRELLARGLVADQDFDWRFDEHTRTVTFAFYGDRESEASMFALQWGENLP